MACSEDIGSFVEGSSIIHDEDNECHYTKVWIGDAQYWKVYRKIDGWMWFKDWYPVTQYDAAIMELHDSRYKWLYPDLWQTRHLEELPF